MPTKLERLEKALPKIFVPQINPFLRALLTAEANSLEEAQINLDEAKNQIFVELASGNFLNDLGKNVDVYRPSYVTLDDGSKELIPGLADDEFRKLIPILSFYPKQIKKTMLAALDIFWGPTYTRATITSQSYAPYNLLAIGFPCELNITTDEKNTIKITFESTDFVDPANATVDEVIGIINNTTDKLTAIDYYDNETSKHYLRIYTNTAGTEGSIQVNIAVGTDANSVFRFSNLIEQFIKVGIYELNHKEIVFRLPEQIPILLDELKGSHHFHDPSHDFYLTCTDVVGGTSYLKSFNYDDKTERLSKGGTIGSDKKTFNTPHGICMDYDYIFVCDTVNTRIIKRKRRDFKYIDEKNTFDAVPLVSPVGITCDETFLYISDSGNHEIIKVRKVDLGFDSRYGTLGAGNNNLNTPLGLAVTADYLFIADSGNNRIMKRDKETLAYISQIGTLGAGNDQFNNPIDVTNDIDNWIFVVDRGNNRIVKRLQTNLNYIAQAVLSNCTAICYDDAEEGLVLSQTLAGTDETIKYWDLDLNETESFSVSNTGDVSTSGLTVFPANQTFSTILDTAWPGSFLYDPRQIVNSFTLTSNRTTLAQNVFKNNTYTTIQVTDTTNFDTNGGFIVLNFSGSNQEELVPYLGKPNATTLTIHPAYVFNYDHDIGEMINVIEKGNYIPNGTGSDYPIYLINPNIAKELVTMLIDLVKAAGIKLRFEIDYTQYKYDYLNNI